MQTCTRVVDGAGDPSLEWVTLEDTRTGERSTVPAAGLFLLLGADPQCSFLPAGIGTDDHGFVLTGRDVPQHAWVDGRPPADLATTVPGVFAVGDIRSGSMKRVATASGEGLRRTPGASLVGRHSGGCHSLMPLPDDRRRQAAGI